ncbi:MAG: hypothetical protein MJ213_03545 [Bacilli bacterium]|nr:hypothetical protein [Bacilli bacterium]
MKKPALSQRMDQLEGRIDRKEKSITNLAKIVEDSFKRVDARIDNLEKDINARLDYIVEANNLKDSK